ncbi:hypothetical protein [Streptacidiphilus cavernicola]|uniref:Translation initiation factor 5A C-terminal domain-containing protein n=1 Tax=Streptacidiphilus cavernicola TaxID=3342716 RepID=A0ABV6W0S7_9ACTN
MKARVGADRVRDPRELRAPAGPADSTIRGVTVGGRKQASIIGLDLFTGTKHETVLPHSAEILVPLVRRDPYTLVEAADDGRLILVTARGELYDDLVAPDDDAARLRKILADSTNGTTQVKVLAACGEERLDSWPPRSRAGVQSADPWKKGGLAVSAPSAFG